jgi:hypothetical protein
MATPGVGKVSRVCKNPSVTRTGFREVIIEIGVDINGITADPDYFEVSKSKNEEVKWVCVQDHDHSKDGPCFTVEFEKNGSPFYESQFSSDAPFSGLAKRNVLPGSKIFEYTVRIAGKNDLDPGGGVKE